MGRKWLFFDIDGTLVPYGEDARPSTRTLDALAALRAQGHKVFLCTGRTKCDIGSTLLCFDVDGVISGAGARIEMGGLCVREKLLPLRLLRRSAAQILRLHVSCILEGTHGFYYVGQGSVKLPWNFPRVTRAGEITHEMCVEKFTAHTSGEAEFAPLAACLAPVYDIYARPDGRFFEMVRKGQDKAWPSAGCAKSTALPKKTPMPLATAGTTCPCSAPWARVWPWALRRPRCAARPRLSPARWKRKAWHVRCSGLA